MTSSVPPVQSSDSIALRAEAARYTLLRRIAPAMRHHLVAHMQPIGMVYAVMGRRLQAPQPNLAEVQDSAQKMHGYARAALDDCLDVITWLAPDPAKTTTALEGTRECLGLISTSLAFRGFTVQDRVAETPGAVRRSAFRQLACGALVGLADQHAAPADIVFEAEPTADALVLTLTLVPAERPKEAAEPPLNYRALEWADLEALAASESAGFERDARRLRISLPWVASDPAP